MLEAVEVVDFRVGDGEVVRKNEVIDLVVIAEEPIGEGEVDVIMVDGQVVAVAGSDGVVEGVLGDVSVVGELEGVVARDVGKGNVQTGRVNLVEVVATTAV